MLRTGPYLSPFYSLMFCVTSAHLAGKEGKNVDYDSWSLTWNSGLLLPPGQNWMFLKKKVQTEEKCWRCPLNTSSCVSRPVLAEHWYSLSYMYFSPVGTVAAVSVGLIVSLFTGTFLCCCFFLAHSLCPPHERKRGFLCLWSGGCGQEVSSELTLMKEDTSLYHLFQFLSHRVSVDQLLILYKWVFELLTWTFDLRSSPLRSRGGQVDATRQSTERRKSATPTRPSTTWSWTWPKPQFHPDPRNRRNHSPGSGGGIGFSFFLCQTWSTL